MLKRENETKIHEIKTLKEFPESKKEKNKTKI